MLPGNGKSLTEVLIALKVTTKGDSFHLFHTFVMKYIENVNTITNMKAKNNLKRGIRYIVLYWFSTFINAYLSGRVHLRSPTYFNPCNVVFNKYWLKCSRHLNCQDCRGSPSVCNRFNCKSFFRLFTWRASTRSRGSNIFCEFKYFMRRKKLNLNRMNVYR